MSGDQAIRWRSGADKPGNKKPAEGNSAGFVMAAGFNLHSLA